jgi:hypothetical protein
MKFLYSLLACLAASVSYGQLRLHSIDFQAPLGGNLGHHNTLNLGATFKIAEKTRMLELGLSGFGENGTQRYTMNGVYNTIYYLDGETNNFTQSERPKYMLADGDSILTQYQTTHSDAIGLRVALRSDYSFKNIPIYTSVGIQLYGNKLNYNRTESFTIYSENPTGFNNEYAPSFSFPESNSESKISFVPQFNAQIGAVLSFNDKLKFIPKLQATASLYEYLNYDLNNQVSYNRVVDLGMAGSFQLSYVFNQ